MYVHPAVWLVAAYDNYLYLKRICPIINVVYGRSIEMLKILLWKKAQNILVLNIN